MTSESETELSLEELLKKQNNGNRRSSCDFHKSQSVTTNSKKRANKNRPREQSSKIPVKSFMPMVKKELRRDPRFDSLCGTFDEKIFRETYSFLDEIKLKEKKYLEDTLKKEVDHAKREQIKYLLKRMKDQERENERKNKNVRKKIEQNEKLKKTFLQGKSAHFKTKSEKKILELVDKYEELKSKGKVQNYMKKKLKKARKLNEDTPFS